MQKLHEELDVVLSALLRDLHLKGNILSVTWLAEDAKGNLKAFGFEWAKSPTDCEIICQSEPVAEFTSTLDGNLREKAEAVLRSAAAPPPPVGPLLKRLR